MREIELPDGWAPYAVLTTPGGDLWTTLLTPAGVARLTADDQFEHHPLPGRPMQIAAAPDGTIWYTREGDRIGSLSPHGDAEIELPAGSAPYGVAVAGDGTVWFSAPGVNAIGHLTDGTITMIDLPGEGSYPAMLTITGDGAVWAALNQAGALARWHDGDLRVLEVPGAPVGVAADGDGVWYADIGGGSVGRVDAAGTVRRFAFADPECRPHAVATDPAGGCAVTLWGSGELARVSPDGETSLARLPGREPHGLAFRGTDVWVAMESGSLVVA